MTALVTVNGEELTLTEALTRLELLQTEDNFLGNCIEELLEREYAQSNNISNSEEELQVAANELRYQRGLELVEVLQQWMKNNHQTVLSVQNGIDAQLLKNKLRGAFTEGEIKAYLAAHPQDFDTVTGYTLLVGSQEEAEKLSNSVKKGENFSLLAMEYSQDEQTKRQGGYLNKFPGCLLPEDIREAVFNASPGEVVGPVKTPMGYQLFKVT